MVAQRGGPLRQGNSHVNLLGDCQHIVHFDLQAAKHRCAFGLIQRSPAFLGLGVSRDVNAIAILIC